MIIVSFHHFDDCCFRYFLDVLTPTLRTVVADAIIHHTRNQFCPHSVNSSILSILRRSSIQPVRWLLTAADVMFRKFRLGWIKPTVEQRHGGTRVTFVSAFHIFRKNKILPETHLVQSMNGNLIKSFSTKFKWMEHSIVALIMTS